MKSVAGLIVACALCVVMTGCAGFARAPVMPPPAAVFTHFKAPLDVDFDKTTMGTKVGRAKTTAILGLVSTGDASTQAAAMNGGIQVIHHADYEMFNLLGIVSSFTTIVYGE